MTEPGRKAPKFPLRLDELQSTARVFHGKPSMVKTSGLKPTVVSPPLQVMPLRSTPQAPPKARAVLRPQEHVKNAHVDARRQVAPSGIGLDSADVRRRMTTKLRAAGVSSDAVLNAMASVPRHLFVDSALVTQAYEDTSLPIGHGQTISKPSVVARMTELLMAGANARRTQSLGRVLEIGTGCGYQAAVLAVLAQQVVSVERLKPLHDKARALLAPLRLAPLGLTDLRLVYGDGMLGHPPQAPYDSIIAAAGGDSLPEAWLTQLAVGGRLVSPVRQAGSQRQVLMVVDRTLDGCHHWVCEAVHFVPLKSGLVA